MEWAWGWGTVGHVFSRSLEEFFWGHLSETRWPEMVGAGCRGSPFLSYTTATAWQSIPSKSRLTPSASLLLQHNLLAGRQTPILQVGTEKAQEPFQLPTSVLRLCSVPVQFMTRVYLGQPGTCANRNQTQLRKEGCPASITQPPAQPEMFSL